MLLCTAVRVVAVVSDILLTSSAELLKDETFDADLVGPTLQSLKNMLERPAESSDVAQFEKVVHGLLSACLINVDEMR